MSTGYSAFMHDDARDHRTMREEPGMALEMYRRNLRPRAVGRYSAAYHMFAQRLI